MLQVKLLRLRRIRHRLAARECGCTSVAVGVGVGAVLQAQLSVWVCGACWLVGA